MSFASSVSHSASENCRIVTHGRRSKVHGDGSEHVISSAKFVTAQRLNNIRAVSACTSRLANEKDDMPTYVINNTPSGIFSKYAEL